MKLVLVWMMIWLSLIALSGCESKRYIEPAHFEIYFLDECEHVDIVPNKDGSLDVENHRKLKTNRDCEALRAWLYVKQLRNIGKVK